MTFLKNSLIALAIIGVTVPSSFFVTKTAVTFYKKKTAKPGQPCGCSSKKEVLS